MVSPLNASMRDQKGILKYLQEAINLDGAKGTNHLATSLATDGKRLQLIFLHPELLLENITKATLKTTNFKRNVRCIVVDEAHLVVLFITPGETTVTFK